MSVDKLQEIKNKQEIYPVGGDDWGRGVVEDDVDWLIEEIDRLRTIEQAYNALRSAL